MKSKARSYLYLERPVIGPYVIEDPLGNNLVISVTPYYENGTRVGYQLDGVNCRHQPRNIIVFDNGAAINAYDNFSDLGIVGTQMFDRKREIFAHFGIDDPELIRTYKLG